eukprot:gene11524-4688_t
MKVELYPSERISRCFPILKKCLYQILINSFKQEFKQDFSIELSKIFQDFGIKNKMKNQFTSLHEEKFELAFENMNTFTMLVLISMPSIFSIIQKNFKAKKKETLNENLFLELIDIWKSWSTEEIDNSDENYCKHALYLISMFYFDFGFTDEFKNILEFNLIFLFGNDEKCNSSEDVTSKISESMVESYFGDEEEEQGISMNSEEIVIEIDTSGNNDTLMKNGNYQKIEELSKDEIIQKISTRYCVFLSTEMKYDPIDVILNGNLNVVVYLKNCLKKIIQLEETPKEIHKKSIVGISKEKCELKQETINLEMKFLNDIYCQNYQSKI